jgi:hypothetical protein
MTDKSTEFIQQVIFIFGNIGKHLDEEDCKHSIKEIMMEVLGE